MKKEENRTNEVLFKLGEACGAGAKTACKIMITLFLAGGIIMRVLDGREKRQIKKG